MIVAQKILVIIIGRVDFSGSGYVAELVLPV